MLRTNLLTNLLTKFCVIHGAPGYLTVSELQAWRRGRFEPRFAGAIYCHEALLAVQMTGVHFAVPMFLKDAALKEQTHEGRDVKVLRATSLRPLFIAEAVPQNTARH